MVKRNLGMLKITNFQFATLFSVLIPSVGVRLLLPSSHRFLHFSEQTTVLTPVLPSPGECWDLGWLPWQGHGLLGFQDKGKSSACTQEAESPRNREPFIMLVNPAVCEDR